MGAAVLVPATSANLGPGFDSFGLALDLHNRVRGRARRRLGASTSRARAPAICATDGAQPASRARWRVAFAEAGRPELRARIGCVNRIPTGSGLGSSSCGDRRRAAARRGARGEPTSASERAARARRRDRGPSRQRRGRALRRLHRLLDGRRTAAARALRAGARTRGRRRRGDRRARDHDGTRDAARGGTARGRRVQRRARGAARRVDRHRAARAARRGARRPAARAVPRRGGRRPAGPSTTSCATPAPRASRSPAPGPPSSDWSPATRTRPLTRSPSEVAERAADGVRALGTRRAPQAFASTARARGSCSAGASATASDAWCSVDRGGPARGRYLAMPSRTRAGDPVLGRGTHVRRSTREPAPSPPTDAPAGPPPAEPRHRRVPPSSAAPAEPRVDLWSLVIVRGARGAHRLAASWPPRCSCGGQSERSWHRASAIAVIPIDGVIAGHRLWRRRHRHARGRSSTSSSRPRTTARVKAIVLRVDSPGGTVAASEEIAAYVKDAEKPVVVSVGDVGASGRLHGRLAGRRDLSRCRARPWAASA